ncbi:MAG: RNA polymerase sigma factor, partial [Caulobacteraceae bacterium]
RAKARIAEANRRGETRFEAPGAVERAERLAAVAAMVYLVFNEGYSSPDPLEAEGPRGALCDEAIRLGRLLLRLFPAEPEIMGLTALMLLQHARLKARFDSEGQVVLLETQDRQAWNRPMIAEGLALIDKAMRHRRPGPYLVQAAIAALHARAPSFEDTDWIEIEALYASLEVLAPSPVVTLNRAAAAMRTRGAADALAMIEPLGQRLAGYFNFHGMRGALLSDLGRKAEAKEAFDRAIALAATPAEAAYIRERLDALSAGTQGAGARRRAARDAGPGFGPASLNRPRPQHP